MKKQTNDNSDFITYGEYRNLFIIKVKNEITNEKNKLEKIKKQTEYTKRKLHINQLERLLEELTTKKIANKHLHDNKKKFNEIIKKEKRRRNKLLHSIAFALVLLLLLTSIVIVILLGVKVFQK
ncbi:hypothetical protein V2E24_00505 [Mycoplasmopsis ciconiae]|uniref:Uncharacterized protein n=1 Tax=Mycoplasmopsis ciconiae TaxID=561067 RepID=A0ABU7MKS9_9BACT|nr:hypothetical protein [Mycoplasmopsis ciconiae]